MPELASTGRATLLRPGLLKMHLSDPRRFTWVYDEPGEADDCVKRRDNESSRVVVWPWF